MGSRFLRHSWFDSGCTLTLQFTDLPEIHTRPLSFGRETHVPCVGPASPPGSEHSGPSWASQGSDWPPLRARDGQLSSTWCCWKGGWQDHSTPSGPSDNSGRNMVSSVLITVGDPDTPWHPHFFRVPAFDPRQFHGYAVEECVEPFP